MSISWQMSNDNRLCGKCPQHTEALPRWTATDKRCRRNVVDRGSCVDAAILRPISITSSMACSPQTPDVSMATGTKSTPEMISAYFCFFFASAAAAAKPACVLLAWMCDVAYVSGQVTSQARHRPLLHGTCVNVNSTCSICCGFAVNLLWICCGFVEKLWICCVFVVVLLSNMLYNKSTTNRSGV